MFTISFEPEGSCKGIRGKEELDNEKEREEGGGLV